MSSKRNSYYAEHSKTGSYFPGLISRHSNMSMFVSSYSNFQFVAMNTSMLAHGMQQTYSFVSDLFFNLSAMTSIMTISSLEYSVV